MIQKMWISLKLLNQKVHKIMAHKINITVLGDIRGWSGSRSWIQVTNIFLDLCTFYSFKNKPHLEDRCIYYYDYYNMKNCFLALCFVTLLKQNSRVLLPIINIFTINSSMQSIYQINVSGLTHDGIAQNAKIISSSLGEATTSEIWEIMFRI